MTITRLQIIISLFRCRQIMWPVQVFLLWWGVWLSIRLERFGFINPKLLFRRVCLYKVRLQCWFTKYFHNLSQGGRGQLQWVLFRGDVGPVGRLHHRVHGPLLHLTGKIRTTCDNDSSDGFLTSFWPQNCSRYLLPNFDWHVFGKIRTKIFF